MILTPSLVQINQPDLSLVNANATSSSVATLVDGRGAEDPPANTSKHGENPPIASHQSWPDVYAADDSGPWKDIDPNIFADLVDFDMDLANLLAM